MPDLAPISCSPGTFMLTTTNPYASNTPGVPGQQAVTFAIPAGVYTDAKLFLGHFVGSVPNSAGWRVSLGTPSANAEGNFVLSNRAPYATPHTGSFGVEDIPASPSVLADINAAAGGLLNCTVYFYVSNTNLFGYQDFITGLTLTLTGTEAEDGGDGDGDTGSGNPPPVSPIVDIATPAQALAARVHSQADTQFNRHELYYLDVTNGNWILFPEQPITSKGLEPKLTRHYQEPAKLQINLVDNYGLLTPKNLESPYNYNAGGQYDPLLREARKIRLKRGVRCLPNLAAGIVPTSTLAPSFGSLSTLTNGNFGDIATGTSGYVRFAPTSTDAFDIVVDLGSIQRVSHVAIRFATKSGTCRLPAAVQWSVSQDGTDWNTVKGATWPARPVGGDGLGAGGDWAEDIAGRTIDVIKTDLDFAARYVRFRVTPQGAGTLALDELAVYGGTNGATFLGGNIFTGYLGDNTSIPPTGVIPLTATDVLKKLADNNSARITASFRNTEIGDIAYSLLTSATYWRGMTYFAPWTPEEIGWSYGAGLTGLPYPVWQGSGNNLLGYLQQIWHTVGWNLFADGSGVLHPAEPPYRQKLPDRVFIADIDGNNDTRSCFRNYEGKNIRNVVQVATGSVDTGQGVNTLLEPNSVALYDQREVVITDALANTRDIRQKICSYVLRDYAWREHTFTNQIRPDFETSIKGIYGFRAPARPNVFPKACGLAGHRHAQELYSLESLTWTLATGANWADAEYIPYVPAGPDPPANVVATPQSEPHSVLLTWDALTDPHVTNGGSIRIYQSLTSETSGYVYQQQVAGNATQALMNSGLSTGVQAWWYLVAIDDTGAQSLPSVIVTATPGSGPGSNSDWAIYEREGYQGLEVAFNSVTPQDYGSGEHDYEFFLTWDAPPAGFKHMELYMSVGSQPSGNTRDGWLYVDELHVDYQGPGTPLNFYARPAISPAIPSGTRVYFRMWTCTSTQGWRGGDFASNVTSLLVP